MATNKIGKIVLGGALFILASGAGAIVFDRLILPRLSQLPVLRHIKFLDSQAPIVITRREEIRIDSGINAQEVVNRIRGGLVKIYPNAISGLVVTNDGLIAAPAALWKSSVNPTVVLENGQTWPAKLVAVDGLSGVAFLKIEAKDLPVLNQVQSVQKHPGEPLLSLSLAESLEVHVRSVSLYGQAAVRPSLTEVRDFLQFNSFLELDPMSSAGEPGAVVVDKDGSLVGFVVLAGDETKVVRAEDLKLTLGRFLENPASPQIVWPKIKLSYLILGPVQAKLLNLPERHGVVLRQGGQGLEAGDFVSEVGGRGINLEDSFQQLLFARKAGEKIRLRLLRQGKEREVEITL